MILTSNEIEFLSAWAREEAVPECYRLPAHRQLLDRRIPGIMLVDFVKSWSRAEGKRDLEIIQAASNPNPAWPWPTMDEFHGRLEKAREARLQHSASQ